MLYIYEWILRYKYLITGLILTIVASKYSHSVPTGYFAYGISENWLLRWWYWIWPAIWMAWGIAPGLNYSSAQLTGNTVSTIAETMGILLMSRLVLLPVAILTSHIVNLPLIDKQSPPDTYIMQLKAFMWPDLSIYTALLIYAMGLFSLFLLWILLRPKFGYRPIVLVFLVITYAISYQMIAVFNSPTLIWGIATIIVITLSPLFFCIEKLLDFFNRPAPV